MKKTIIISLILPLFFFLLPKDVYGASCTGFTASVKDSYVTLSAASCNPEGRYLMQVLKSGEVLEAIDTQTINGKNEASVHLNQEGNYNARLIFAAELIDETSFSIEPQNLAPLKCGDPCNQNDTNCPSKCPSTYMDGRWICYQPPTSAPKQPTSPPPYLPQTGGESSGIDFDFIASKIPNLNDIFKPGPASNVSAIISRLVEFLFVVAGLLLLFYLIAGGFQLMVSANNEKGVAEAKAKMTNAIIGFLLLFVSFWLVQIIEFIFGVKLI